MKGEYETNVKNALIITLIYGLKENTPHKEIYKQAMNFLKTYGINVKSIREIDDLSHKYLLTNSKLEKMLQRYIALNEPRFGSLVKNHSISKLAFSSIYLYLKKGYHLELEENFGVKRRLRISSDTGYDLEKVHKNRRRKGVSFGIVNKKPIHDTDQS